MTWEIRAAKACLAVGFVAGAAATLILIFAT